ncbi:MAG: hypothetical protein AAB362_02215 [Patescibacteria group bacterium]
MNINFFYQKHRSIALYAPQKAIIIKINRALELIQSVDKKEYKKLFLRLRVIFITRRHGITNEFFMPEKIWFANRSLIEKNDVSWIASLIIHEAFHATQFKRGKYIVPLDKLEPPALKVQAIFLKKIEGTSGITAIESVKKNKYWKKMAKDVKSYTYFRNLLKYLENQKL